MQAKITTPKKAPPETVKAQLDFIRRGTRPPEQLELFDNKMPVPPK